MISSTDLSRKISTLILRVVPLLLLQSSCLSLCPYFQPHSLYKIRQRNISIIYPLEEQASQVVLVIKNCLPMQKIHEMWIQSLGQEDPLEEEMATYSSILAWRIPGTEEPSGLPSMGSHRVGHDWSDLAAAAAAGRETQLEHTCRGGGRKM